MRKIALDIRELQQFIKQKFEQEKTDKDLHLTHGQVRVLMYINNQDCPVYQKDIEDFLNVRRSTTTEILNVLERGEFILRNRATHDGRLKEIILTKKTLDIIDEMASRLLAMDQLLKSNIEPSDLDVFFKVIDQMKENLK